MDVNFRKLLSLRLLFTTAIFDALSRSVQRTEYLSACRGADFHLSFFSKSKELADFSYFLGYVCFFFFFCWCVAPQPQLVLIIKKTIHALVRGSVPFLEESSRKDLLFSLFPSIPENFSAPLFIFITRVLLL